MSSEPKAKFWRLLAAYEALTREESVAIGQNDFSSLIEAQRLKTVIMPEWLELRLALDHPEDISAELQRRLDALAALEHDNRERFNAILVSARERIWELAQIKVRLARIRRSYEEEEIPDAVHGGFARHG